MKKFYIEWSFQDFSGEFVIEAQSSKEAMKKMRSNYPGFEVNSFAVGE
jgi:hypothetical protein